jgi:glycosyltransferase involved in cell wall biosynthesis
VRAHSDLLLDGHISHGGASLFELRTLHRQPESRPAHKIGGKNGKLLLQVETSMRSIRHHLGLTDEPVVMFVGGFYPWHDLSLLVESFGNLLRSAPDARLVLVGDGETRPTLEKMIKEQDLKHAVIMTGAVDHHRVPEMLAVADVAVAPNIPFFGGHGGSPLKIFEYMAAGKAIIASGTGQIAEVIHHGHNGLLVKPGDADDLARAMLRLINDPAERARLGRNARQQAVERHSWEHYAKELEQIYLSVL